MTDSNQKRPNSPPRNTQVDFPAQHSPFDSVLAAHCGSQPTLVPHAYSPVFQPNHLTSERPTPDLDSGSGHGLNATQTIGSHPSYWHNYCNSLPVDRHVTTPSFTAPGDSTTPSSEGRPNMAALMQQRSQGFASQDSILNLSNTNHAHLPGRPHPNSQWSWPMQSPAYRFTMSNPLEPHTTNHTHLPPQNNHMLPLPYSYNSAVSPSLDGQPQPRSYTMPAAYRALQPSTLAPTQDHTSNGSGKRKQAEPPSQKKDIRRTNGSTSNAGAPGPIPASQPRIVEGQAGGVRIIEFEYNKKKEKHAYKIRCNVESVRLDGFSQDFKMRNAIYPTALHVGPEKKRRPYETQCNELAWALVHLNPELDGQRGLIQRAVDSWRNTSPDTKYHSRRVKRQKRVPRSRQDEVESLSTTKSSGSFRGTDFDEGQTSPKTSRGRSTSQSRSQDQTEAWELPVPFSRGPEYSVLGPSPTLDGVHGHRVSPQTSVHSQDMTYLPAFQHEAFAHMAAEGPAETAVLQSPMQDPSRSMAGSVFALPDERGHMYDCGSTPSVMPRICR